MTRLPIVGRIDDDTGGNRIKVDVRQKMFEISVVLNGTLVPCIGSATSGRGSHAGG